MLLVELDDLLGAPRVHNVVVYPDLWSPFGQFVLVDLFHRFRPACKVLELHLRLQFTVVFFALHVDDSDHLVLPVLLLQEVFQKVPVDLFDRFGSTRVRDTAVIRVDVVLFFIIRGWAAACRSRRSAGAFCRTAARLCRARFR